MDNKPTMGLTQWGERTAVDGVDVDVAETLGPTTRVFAGRYLMLEHVGEGGMGVVVAAWDTRLERRVALKMVRPQRVRPDTISRLHREAQAMARLNHANVAVVHDVGEHDGKPYVAMEFVAGQDLNGWLQVEDRSWQEILEVFVAAAQGLRAAHEAGIIHRDFKPGNVLVGHDGRIRVSDFGLARAVDAGPEAEGQSPQVGAPRDPSALDTTITHEGVLLGTPAYMAPEQVLEGRADQRSDQFAFCVALFQALYGHHPFSSAGSGQDIAMAAAAGPLESPDDDRGVPAWLFTILSRGLQPKPEDRFPDMKALCSALRDDPRRRRQRRTRMRVVGAVVGLALLLVAIVPVNSWLGKRRLRTMGLQASAASVSEARLGELENRFEEVAGPRGREIARSVANHLGEYVDRWRSTWDECAVRRQRTEIREWQLSCLSRRIRTADALSALFETADLEVVADADQAVLALRPPESCADAVPPSERAPRPTDAETVRRIEEVEAMIDRAEALQLAGDFTARLEVLQGAASAAREIVWPPLESAALVALGTAEGDLGHLDVAGEALRRSLSEAERGRDDAAACHAAIQLAWVHGVLDSDFDVALGWYEFAAAKVERLGGEFDEAAEVAAVGAAVLREAGRYDEALAEQQRALELVGQTFGLSGVEAARAWHSMGMLRAERGEFDEAERAYRKALELKTAALGSENPGTSMTLSSLADVLVNQGRADEAVEMAKTAVFIHEAALSPDHPELAKALTTYGVALEESGDVDAALVAYSRAVTEMTTAHGPDHVQVGYARLNLAILRHGLGRTSEAVEDAAAAADILAAALGEDHPHVAFAENNLGMLLHYAGRSRAAVGHLERALELRSNNGADLRLVAQTRFNLGRAVWSSGQESRGLGLIRTSHREAESLGNEGSELQTTIEDWLKEH